MSEVSEKEGDIETCFYDYAATSLRLLTATGMAADATTYPSNSQSGSLISNRPTLLQGHNLNPEVNSQIVGKCFGHRFSK